MRPLSGAERPDRALILANFRAVVRQIDAQDPGESRLLKAAQGEDGHPGGILLPRTGKAYQRLQQFVFGASLGNRPPEAIVLRRCDGKAGEELEIDGTRSNDPDGQRLHFRWRVVERPPGSVASVLGDNRGAARFKPDRAGVYRVELEVFDGRLWGLPAVALVVVAAKRDPPGKTGGGSGAAAPAIFVERRLETARLRRIRRLFLDLKWRSPHLFEVISWYDKPHAQLVDAFLRDEELWASWYEQQLFYFGLLDRRRFRPRQGRLATLPTRLTDGRLSIPRALEEIVRSRSFGARNPGSDPFVTVVLERCLGLVVQERRNLAAREAGKRMYDGYAAKLFRQRGSSQADFVHICFRQRLFFEHLLSRTWKALHGTEIEEQLRQVETDRLVADPLAFQAILRGWLNGPRYLDGVKRARTKAEIPYVRGLFVDALGRLPSQEELRDLRNTLRGLADPMPARLAMGGELLDSAEAKVPAVADPERFVKEQFVRLLARLPGKRELDRLAGALRSDPEVTPRVVIRTLLLSPEYQGY